MNILIVEDDNFKLEKLIKFFQEKYPHFKINSKSAFQPALTAILEGGEVGLIILDMSIPTYQRKGPTLTSGTPRGLGGMEIMERMLQNNILIPTIIVTQYREFDDNGNLQSLSELEAKLSQEFKKFYIGTVYYSTSSSTWGDDLVENIKKVVI